MPGYVGRDVGGDVSSAALETLLHELVDYAGLFPPAALPMAEAVRAYDEHRRGAHAWMLGRFVLPIARLEEFEATAGPLLARGAPWRLAALGGAGDREVLERANARLAGRAVVDTLEVKALTAADVAALEACAGLCTPAGEPVPVYVELPVVEDPGALVAAIAALGLRAKVRTGGVTSDAFPTAAQLARFLAVCAAHDVVFKATAGLHHPLSGEYALTDDRASPRGPMFGFLNVFLAALFLRAGLAESGAAALLEERDARAIAFDAGGVSWRGHRLDAHSVDTLRERFAASFGSCSFAEPVESLTAMGLL